MIFIDSGAFIARGLAGDRHHAAALAHWGKLRSQSCFTSNLVLSEVLTLLARRSSYEFAADYARTFFTSGVLTILRTDLQDEWQAVALMAKFKDQQVSFADCTSFVLMRKHKIRRAFSFDRHFTLAGFRVEP